MDSTMLYQLVLEQMHTKKQLLNLLPPMAQLSHAQPLTTANMNDQQIFSQLYNAVQHTLQEQEHDKELLIAQMPNSDIEEESEVEDEMDQEEEEEMEEENNDWEDPQGEAFGRIDQEDNQEDQEDGIPEEEVYDGEEDVDLYGEEIDQEEMESYANEGGSEEYREFQQEEKMANRKRNTYRNEQEEDDEGEDLMNDQFDHFRELQLKQQQEEVPKIQDKTELQKQIDRFQSKVISKKDWVLKGEVKGTQRPVNSLLQYDLQFKTGIKLSQQITPQYNQEIETMIKQRVLDELYDDRVRYEHSHVLREQFSSLKKVSTEKSKMGLGELYQADFKNFLGLTDNKQDTLKKDILQSFKEVNYMLDSLSNHHFTPAPTRHNAQEAVISQQKVPMHLFDAQPSKTKIPRNMVSDKQEDKKGKRIKNKRIARTRKKQQDKKKLNKKIEYGGMTKFQAKALGKKNKNNLNTEKVKYNKSSNFFAEMNKEKKGKPNPNLQKLKI